MTTDTAAEQAAGHGAEHSAGTAAEPPQHGYSPAKGSYVTRMKRIEGQVRGIERMISEDAYCIDVLTQVSAVTKALQSVSLALLEDHLNHCVVGAARESDEAARGKVAEATAAIARLWKS